jgi:hypothetical protein
LTKARQKALRYPAIGGLIWTRRYGASIVANETV